MASPRASGSSWKSLPRMCKAGGASRRADVEELVVAARRNTVWQLTEMLASRRRQDALAFLDNLLREGEQPAGIVGALAWTYRKLIEARASASAHAGFSGRPTTRHAT